MTLKKKPVPRGYDTFPSPSESQDNAAPSASSPDKTRSVGLEAQRLATQGLWSDNYINRTPLSNNSEMGREEEGYPREDYPSDPPPIYTPSETTVDSTPSSPAIARSQPQPVGEPRSPTQDVAYPSIREEAEDEDEDEVAIEQSSGPYSSSPLLERAQLQSDDRPQRCARWATDRHKHRGRRFKRACWFACALVMCLWLMLPAFFDGRAGVRGPGWRHKPSDDLKESPLPTGPVLPTREYRQHETSSSITGTFKLYDLLELQTSSGSINIKVEPQPGDGDAVMKIKTKSGSVRIQMGKGILPWLPSSDETNRTFETSISTSSGSVTGSLVAGNGGLTSIQTSSGSITLTIHTLDLGPKGKTSRLETTSSSGSQNLDVASSSSHDLRNLEAQHLVKGSASLRIMYPKRWLGKLHMRSLGSGSVQARGSGLEFEQDGNKEKYAWRGQGDLNEVAVIVQGSGSALFSC